MKNDTREKYSDSIKENNYFLDLEEENDDVKEKHNWDKINWHQKFSEEKKEGKWNSINWKTSSNEQKEDTKSQNFEIEFEGFKDIDSDRVLKQDKLKIVTKNEKRREFINIRKDLQKNTFMIKNQNEENVENYKIVSQENKLLKQKNLKDLERRFNLHKNKGFISKFEKEEFVKIFFLNYIIPNLIEKKIIKEGDTPRYKDLALGGYPIFIQLLSKGKYKMVFNDLLSLSGFSINKDPNRWNFLDVNEKNIKLTKEEQKNIIGDYFNNNIIPLLFKRGLINSLEDINANINDSDFNSYLTACYKRGFLFKDIIEASKQKNINTPTVLIQKLYDFLGKQSKLIKDGKFIPTPKNIIKNQPLFSEIGDIDRPISNWIKKNLDYENLNDFIQSLKIKKFINKVKGSLSKLSVIYNTSKTINQKAELMLNDLLDVFNTSDNNINALYKSLGYYNNYKMLSGAIFFFCYNSFYSQGSHAKLSSQDIGKKIDINSASFTRLRYWIFRHLRKNPDYYFILPFCETSWLDSSEYNYIINHFLKLFQKYIKKYYENINLVNIEKEIKSKIKNIKNIYGPPHIKAAIISLIHLRYIKNKIINQKSFILLLKKIPNFKISYQVFNKNYKRITQLFFKEERKSYKTKVANIKTLYHHNIQYDFTYLPSRLELGFLGNILLRYFNKINKKFLPTEFYDMDKKFSSSNLILKGIPDEPLYLKSREDSLNIYDDLLKKLNPKLLISSHDYFLCKYAKKVFNYFHTNGLGNPDHAAIYDEVLNHYSNSVASEIPVWKSCKKYNFNFIGYIDLISISENSINVIDFKQNVSEIFRSIPQIASYGIMLEERLQDIENYNYKIKCITFCPEICIEFKPEILKNEIRDFILYVDSVRNNPLKTRDKSMNLIDMIDILLS